MRLLIDPTSKEAYRSLTDDHPFRFPDFSVGDVVPIFVALTPKIGQQWDSNIFAPIDVSDYTIRVALGGLTLPDSGSFSVSYDSETSPLRIAWNPTASDLESALNEIDALDLIGGVDVVGSDGFFTITFRDVGVVELIEADPVDLVPVSLIEIVRATTGDVDTREVQTFRIRQDVGAVATLEDDSETPAIVVTVVQAGTVSLNHEVRLTFPSDRWGGRWTFTALGGTSDFIPYAASQEQIQAAIEAMTVVGKNNISVTQESENVFFLMFKNGRGLQDIGTITADGTALQVITTKSGELDLTGAQVEFLFAGNEPTAIVQFEVEATPASGSTEIVLRKDVILHRSILAPN